MSTRYQKCNGCGSPGEVSANGYCSKCQTKESAWYEDVWSIPIIGPVLLFAGYGLTLGTIAVVGIGLAMIGLLPIVFGIGVCVAVIAVIVEVFRHFKATAPARQAERVRKQVEEAQRQALLPEQRTHVKEAELAKYRQLRSEIEHLPEYARWRNAVIEKYERRCAICGSTDNIEVDHRYRSFFAIVRGYGIQNVVQAYECKELWDVNNGSVLCKAHHDQTRSSKYRVAIAPASQ